jgi:hypothetical protein|tara:strand:+ start:826 stop:1008 length:183 start_codon:yes stop_codon:yes gene_type:complete
MQFRNIVIAAEDFGCTEIDTVAKIVEEYIEELNLSDSNKLTGFSWRIDVSMRYDNAISNV